MRYGKRLGEVTPFDMPGIRTPNVPAVDVQNISPDNPTEGFGSGLGGLGNGWPVPGPTFGEVVKNNWPLFAAAGAWYLLRKRRR